MTGTNAMEKTSGQRFISKLVSVWTYDALEEDASLFLLSSGHGPGRGAADRFALESEWLRRANHPHLLRVLPGDEEGRRKAEPLLREWPGNSNWLAGLSLGRRLLLFAQLASVVGGLHRAGRVHGMLHPDRCGLRPNGELVLLDLGMTWWSAGDVAGGGDPLFCCAPECLAGSEPDARSDIFSLGGMLQWFLTGRNEPAGRERSSKPMPLPGELASFQPLLTFMMSERPAQRPSSVTMVLDQLNAILMRLPQPVAADGPEVERSIERTVTALSGLSQRPALLIEQDGALPPRSDAGRWMLRDGGYRLPAWLWMLFAAIVIAAVVAVGFRMRTLQEPSLVESLLDKARTQMEDGRVLFPEDDNALDTLRTLRGVDAGNAEVLALTRKMEQRAVASLEDAMRSSSADDQLDAALNAAIRTFPDNEALATLSARLARARRSASDQASIERLLNRFDAWVDSGAAAPADEAFASLRQAVSIAPGDPEVTTRRRRMEVVLIQHARQALADESLIDARRRIGLLREWSSDAAVLNELEAEYARRYVAAAGPDQLKKLLAEAAGLEKAAGTDLERLGRALDLYLQARLLSPDAATTNAGVDASTVRVASTASAGAHAALEKGNWTQATEWLALARKADPNAAEVRELANRIDQEQKARVSTVRDLLDKADLARRRGRYFAQGGQGAWALYMRAAAMMDDKSEARAGLAEVRKAMLAEVDTLISRKDYDAAAKLVRAGLASIGGDAELERRKLTLASIERQRKRQQESTAAVPTTGFLAINATPWAHIGSVTDASSGKAMPLAGDATTPLRMTVPAGEYRVVLRDPEKQRERRLTVKVQAGKVSQANANFQDAQ